MRSFIEFSQLESEYKENLWIERKRMLNHTRSRETIQAI